MRQRREFHGEQEVPCYQKEADKIFRKYNEERKHSEFNTLKNSKAKEKQRKSELNFTEQSGC